MTTSAARVLLSTGEPAGVGPDLTLQIATRSWDAALIACGDPALLDARARALGLAIDIVELDRLPDDYSPHVAGRLPVWPVKLTRPVVAGTLDAANADYVIAMLRMTVDACVAGDADAMVTAPVHKGVINDAGHPFTGHTEFLAARTGASQPVMLLCAGSLRVALATTHLALREVPAAITPDRLRAVLTVLDADLRRRFAIEPPRIAVCGLNPHAGEGGHLGSEEIEVIAPLLEAMRAEGLQLSGPLPADTAFTPAQLERCDAVLAMYHDQGLPVLKATGFGNAVNVTLGLPIVRTSVDHGTALDLAGSGTADAGSLSAALALAIDLAR